jgi:hypothetical protein
VSSLGCLTIPKISNGLYKAFAPAEAKRILDKLEFHYTPTHGSWLNMAEIELSVLTRQCLNQRIPDLQQLQREVTALGETSKSFRSHD